VEGLTLSEYGMTEKNGIPVVSSRIVAEKFNKQHEKVLSAINNLFQKLPPENGEISDFDQKKLDDFYQYNFIHTQYKDSYGRKQPEYLLTRDGFSYIAMGFTGKKAAKFKIDYINAFNEMEAFIKNLLEVKADFPEFTDAIMAAHEEPRHYHFSNECNMINSIVLGVTAKQFREAHGIERGKSIRPYLTQEQISAVKALQRIDIGLIIAIPDYQQRKSILEQQLARIGQRKLAV
jgi:Rha family phage regulatory protein